MFANLIYLEPKPGQSRLAKRIREAANWLRPDGGIAFAPFPDETANRQSWLGALREAATGSGLTVEIGSTGVKLIRGPLAGSGEWSHQYGNASNAAFGGEKLSGVSNTDDLEVQWIGRPGPRAQPDRNGRKPAPLSTGGRLFVQGLNRILALDAYNGTVLWSRELPEIQRFNMPRDSSNWAANREHLFCRHRRRMLEVECTHRRTGEPHSGSPGCHIAGNARLVLPLAPPRPDHRQQRGTRLRIHLILGGRRCRMV